jgi:hypothetical protein
MVREPELLLLRFMARVISVESIGMPEICVYAVLFQLWAKGGFENPIRMSRSQVMHLSCVKSKTTYHKCIGALCSQGFIRYEPCYHPLGSWVWVCDII